RMGDLDDIDDGVEHVKMNRRRRPGERCHLVVMHRRVLPRLCPGAGLRPTAPGARNPRLEKIGPVGDHEVDVSEHRGHPVTVRLSLHLAYTSPQFRPRAGTFRPSTFRVCVSARIGTPRHSNVSASSTTRSTSSASSAGTLNTTSSWMKARRYG